MRVAGDLGEALHEVAPAELAVGQHREAVGLLLGDDLADRIILDRAQLVSAESAAVRGGERRHELRRTQQAPNRVDARVCDIDLRLH